MKCPRWGPSFTASGFAASPRWPGAVRHDVREGYVSPEAARRDYGVTIDTPTG